MPQPAFWCKTLVFRKHFLRFTSKPVRFTSQVYGNFHYIDLPFINCSKLSLNNHSQQNQDRYPSIPACRREVTCSGKWHWSLCRKYKVWGKMLFEEIFLHKFAWVYVLGSGDYNGLWKHTATWWFLPCSRANPQSTFFASYYNLDLLSVCLSTVCGPIGNKLCIKVGHWPKMHHRLLVSMVTCLSTWQPKKGDFFVRSALLLDMALPMASWMTSLRQRRNDDVT